MIKLTLQDSTLYDNEPKETSKASKEMNAVDALRCQYEHGFVNRLHLTDEENAREVKDCPVWYEIKGGKTYFYTSHYVGSWKVNNVLINIIPRFGIISRLLSYALHIYLPEKDMLIEKENDTPNIIALMWRVLLQRAIQNGNIPRSYISEIKNIRNFKGRLDVKKQVKYNIANKSKFYCSYRHITFDNLINKTILYTYEMLKQEKNVANVTKALSAHINKLYELKVCPIKQLQPSMLDSITYTQMSLCYKPFISLCKMLIEQQGKKCKDNLLCGFSFFIDIAELWEQALLNILKEGLADEPFIDVYSPNQTGGEYLTTDGYRQVRPDIIIKKENKIAIIIDAKWKRYKEFGATDCQGGVNRDDLYQMMTYLYHYARADDKVMGLFVAPTLQKGIPPDVHQLTNSQHSIGLLNLNFSDEEENNFVQKKIAFIKQIKKLLIN